MWIDIDCARFCLALSYAVTVMCWFCTPANDKRHDDSAGDPEWRGARFAQPCVPQRQAGIPAVLDLGPVRDLRAICESDEYVVTPVSYGELTESTLARANKYITSYFPVSGAFKGGGPGGHGPPVKSRGRWEKANTPPFDNLFLKFFKKHKQRGDPLELFYGPSLHTELDTPLFTVSTTRTLRSSKLHGMFLSCFYQSTTSQFPISPFTQLAVEAFRSALTAISRPPVNNLYRISA